MITRIGDMKYNSKNIYDTKQAQCIQKQSTFNFNSILARRLMIEVKFL